MVRMIARSVGEGAATSWNVPDVKTVLDLLNTVPVRDGGTKESPLQRGVPSGKLIGAIRRFQLHHFGVTNGRIDPDNVTISLLNKYDSGRASGPLAFSSDVHSFVIKAARLRIVEQAKTLLGKVSNRRDAEQARTGWRVLRDIYVGAGAAVEDEATYQARKAKEAREKRKIAAAPGVVPLDDFLSAPTSPGDKGTYPAGMRWCGIFATWALNQAGFHLVWIAGKAISYSASQQVSKINAAADGRGADLGVTTGDVCIVNDKSDDLKSKDNPQGYHWHHVIVASEPGLDGSFDVIEGNYTDAGGARQCIVDETTRFGAVRRKTSEIISRYDLFRPQSL